MKFQFCNHFVFELSNTMTQSRTDFVTIVIIMKKLKNELSIHTVHDDRHLKVMKLSRLV